MTGGGWTSKSASPPVNLVILSDRGEGRLRGLSRHCAGATGSNAQGLRAQQVKNRASPMPAPKLFDHNLRLYIGIPDERPSRTSSGHGVHATEKKPCVAPAPLDSSRTLPFSMTGPIHFR